MFLGWIPLREIPFYFSMADVVYYGLDIYHINTPYNAPNALGYALALGRPLIATESGDLGRIVKEENCGILIKEASTDEIVDAINKLRDNHFRELLKKNAVRAGREKYNWNIMEKKLLKIYRDF